MVKLVIRTTRQPAGSGSAAVSRIVVLSAMALTLSMSSVAVAAIPTRKAPRQNRNAPVELFAVNSKETLQLRLRDDNGRPMRGVQKRFDALMKCHFTKKQHAMNPRLIRMLFQIGKHYPGRRIEIVSGYRHPSVAKNPRSPHMQGLACDFRLRIVTGGTNDGSYPNQRGAPDGTTL